MTKILTPSRPVAIRFSEMALRAKPSGIRAAQAERDDMIAFSKGHPDSELFSVRDLMADITQILSDPAHAHEALQYSAGAGTDALRHVLCDLMARNGVPCAPDNILVTNGSQQGLFLASLGLADRLDRVVARQPVYTGALQVFDSLGLMLAEPGDTVENPRLLYEIPNFHNPTGTSLDLEARKKLVAMAHRTGAVLIEDDPYGMLRFDGTDLPGLLALDAAGTGGIDGARTLYLGSLSKTVAPGLRIGWIAGPRDIIAKLTLLKYIQDIQSGTFVQNLAARFLRGAFQAGLDPARARYRAGRDWLVAALDRHFGARGHWQVPEGGFFLWLELAGGVDATELLLRAIERGVNFVPGSAFGPASRFGSCLRLSFSCNSQAETEEGIRRLAAAYDDLVGRKAPAD